MAKETRSDEERLGSVSKRLTPELEALIRARLADNALPEPLKEAIGPEQAEKVAEDRAPLESVGDNDVAALEAIVQRFGRPPLIVRGGAVELEPLPDFPPETPGWIVASERWLPSVGRVEFVNHDQSWGGTGWVIQAEGSARIVATNRHVAKVVAKRRSDGRAVFMRSPAGIPFGMNIDFAEEVGSQGDAHTVAVTDIKYLADDLSADVALLRIEAGGPALPDPLDLADTEAQKGHVVALIGYPAQDSRNDAADQARYFRDLYEVKRFAPGFVMQPLSDSTNLIHDCTSLGGNSGSPVLSLEHRKVVGLHFSGRYGKFNSAVGVATLKKLLATGAITPGDKLDLALVEGKRDDHHDAVFFTKPPREGFDQQFLGVPSPWPKLPDGLQQALVEPSDGPSEPNELRYRHFGVKYSGQHKLPLVTAVNIDGKHAVRIKRGDDQWFTDGRIPKDVQLGSANFADLQIDRGHMVRREDPNWDLNGSAEETQIANDDTFHYVNAAAQHSALNQGKTLWQGLENYILDSARTKLFRACVFTGPVLRPDDAEEPDMMIDGALVPLEFWKVVAVQDHDTGKLRATAYLLSQGQLIQDLLLKRSQREALEGFEFGAYRTFQVSVRDLAEATGYDFGPYVEADAFIEAADAHEAVNSSEPMFMAIDEFRSLVL